MLGVIRRRPYLHLAIAAGLAALVALAHLEARTRPAAPSSFVQARDGYRSSEAMLLDRHGDPVQTLRVDFGARRLAWTPLPQVSPALVAAVIGAEDRRFRSHGGVDAVAVAGALRDRLLGRARRGASTLEMQLAAKLDPALEARTGRRDGRRGWLQKLRQMRAARALRATWSKDEVLEAYLNLVSFRGETQGVAAAAQRLFGKQPAGLTADESAILAALLPAPQAAPLAVGARACAISARTFADVGTASDRSRGTSLQASAAALQTTIRNKQDALEQSSSTGPGRTDLTQDPRGHCDALRRLALAALEGDAATPAADGIAPHLARRLLRAPGEALRSTLDARIQRIALDALQTQLRALDGERVRDGAAVVVDNASGEVLAYVGSAGPASRSGQVDGARALRQAGSTLKPFLYALAIERGWLTAASLLDDSPLALEAGPGLYLPQNYEHDFKGLVSVRTALAGSLNIPAVRTLLLAGVEPFRERLRALGYTGGLTESGEFYGYSLALGSAEVSLLEQVNAYRALANGGAWSPLRLRPDEDAAAARAVVSPQAAWIVSDILSDRGARAVTFDLDGPLSTPYWSAVKTGTSKNLRDNWCIGYTRRHTVGIWVGNFEGDAMRSVSGISGAAPAWRAIMDALADGSAAPEAPPGLLQRSLRYDNGVEPPRSEWFIAGTETARVVAAAPDRERARLISPAAGSLIALDPDIPLDRQHVLLRAEPADAALRLQLDGTDRGHAGTPRLWTPLPGEHRLRLVDTAGAVVDEIGFVVRVPR